jgi:tetratricopeptide (TPR) repeat protein
VEKDASLLETGILVLADEKSEKDIKAAIDLYEKFLVKLPKSRSATFVKTYYLPNALMGSGDLDAAATRIEKLVKEVDEQAQPGLNIFLGDIKAIKGDAEGAQKIYGEALKSIPEKLEKNDARASAKRYLEVKVALVGKPAPEINSETWLGAKARPLSALKGTVVLVDVWATW